MKRQIDEAEEEIENEIDMNKLKANIPKVILHSASSSHTASINDAKSKVCLMQTKSSLKFSVVKFNYTSYIISLDSFI